MKLTARQTAFLELAAREEGFDPYEAPSGAPVMKATELNPLVADELVRFCIDCPAWHITAIGRAALAEAKAK